MGHPPRRPQQHQQQQQEFLTGCLAKALNRLVERQQKGKACKEGEMEREGKENSGWKTGRAGWGRGKTPASILPPILLPAPPHPAL